MGTAGTRIATAMTSRNHLLPTADQAVSALLCDLDDRGLLAETLVVCTGEMGRTPRAGANWGRDHWSTLFPALTGRGGGAAARIVRGILTSTRPIPSSTRSGPRISRRRSVPRWESIRTCGCRMPGPADAADRGGNCCRSGVWMRCGSGAGANGQGVLRGLAGSICRIHPSALPTNFPADRLFRCGDLRAALADHNGIIRKKLSGWHFRKG
ncbi:MAG: DUF1501 domain-containing protein [Planctomycetaceae bacterium]